MSNKQSNQGFLPGLQKKSRNTSHGETWCRNIIFMVLWHGRSCDYTKSRHHESVGELSTVGSRKMDQSLWFHTFTTRRISANRWHWSPGWLLVDSRWLHLSSSQWTSSSALCVEGRNIPYSTKIRWCNKVYSYWSGRHARKTYWWLLECRFEQKFVRFLESIYKLYSIERQTFQGKNVVWEEADKDSNG